MLGRILKWGMIGWTGVCLAWFAWAFFVWSEDVRRSAADSGNPFLTPKLAEIVIAGGYRRIALWWVVLMVAAGFALFLFTRKSKDLPPPGSGRMKSGALRP